jgi:hypothetical protein
LCGNGYTVANGKLATYFAADLMHRIYHTTKIGEGAADHFADTYSECLELAEEKPSDAVRNTHSLQYFAIEVYAMEIALPGEGCTGVIAEGETDSHGAAPAVSSASSAMSSAATSTTAAQTAAQTVSKVSSAATVSLPSFLLYARSEFLMLTLQKECHTHAGGEVHCADLTPAETPSMTTTQSVSKTTSAGTECHTHANGDVHCS